MSNPDTRRFIPPPLFRDVCNFAITEVMSTGIGELNEFDYTVQDCLQIAMLYPRNPPEFRLPRASALATLYNAYADLQDRLQERKGS